MRRHVQDLLPRPPEVHRRVEPPGLVLERAVHVGHAELAQRPVGECERSGVLGLGARSGKAHRGREAARDAARVLLEQGVDTRQREALQLEMRVRAPAGREIALEDEPPGIGRAVQRHAGDPDHGIAHHDFGRPLEKPYATREQHGQGVHGNGRQWRIAGRGGGGAPREPSPGEKRAEVADAGPGEPRQ